MRFEISFNEKISREQATNYFESVWKSYLTKTKRLWYFIIPFLLFGVLIVYGKSNLGYLFITAGLYFLLRNIQFIEHYTKNKNKYFDLVEDNIKKYASSEKTCVWEFQEEAFCYSDYKFDLKIKWAAFNKFNVEGKTLMIELRDNIIANFFLNESEVGEENFNKIILFLGEKIKNS